ncbi:uncharacterized protein LOC134257437 [Saccostrea cucullata]|uniref:uncharacterized protein LOC134257437 n=1 Tax=Saccostrea cuccullata TaxID=36930 RepID=UPI002ED11081
MENACLELNRTKGTMDNPEAQVAVNCDQCDIKKVQSYCDICFVNLCKACVGEHLSNLSSKHKVVPFQQRQYTFDQLKFQTELEEGESYVYPRYKEMESELRAFNKKKEEMKGDLEELETVLYPQYKEMESEIHEEKSEIESEYETLTSAVTQQGENWHKEIELIVNKQKSEIDEMKHRHLAILEKQEAEITRLINELEQKVVSVKETLDSNNIAVTTSYNSINDRLRVLPVKANCSLPTFTPNTIKEEHIHLIRQCFGSLTTFSVLYERDIQSAEEVHSKNDDVFSADPQLITTINTKLTNLHNITCFKDESVWISGEESLIKLYNLKDALVNGFQTRSGNAPYDIAVSKSGNLIYTDRDFKAVYKVINEQIKELIRFRDWTPYNICVSSNGALLITLGRNKKHSKIVRCKASVETQTIQYDTHGKPLFSIDSFTVYSKYICENKNLDICVADSKAQAVVVVNQAGLFRFRYTGHPTAGKKKRFCPIGIASDSYCHILTTDVNENRIHILDQDGKFIRYIDNCDLLCPWGLCVDIKDNLFVVECHSSKVKKIKYLN